MIPAALVGVLLDEQIESFFNGQIPISGMYVIINWRFAFSC